MSAEFAVTVEHAVEGVAVYDDAAAEVTAGNEEGAVVVVELVQHLVGSRIILFRGHQRIVEFVVGRCEVTREDTAKRVGYRPV